MTLKMERVNKMISNVGSEVNEIQQNLSGMREVYRKMLDNIKQMMRNKVSGE